MPADAAFAAAGALGEKIAAERAERRKAAQDARNARRRARYAARPKLPATPRTTAVEDEWIEPGCYCQSVPMPPCAWCEGGGNPYDEDEADQ